MLKQSNCSINFESLKVCGHVAIGGDEPVNLYEITGPFQLEA